MLIISHAAPNWQPSDFAAICCAARRNNAARGLRAALLFDGYRFVEMIEGPPDAVQDLAGTLAQDRRHQGLKIVSDEAVARDALDATWMSGFCAPDALDIFVGPQGPHGAAAIAIMRELLRGADLSS